MKLPLLDLERLQSRRVRRGWPRCQERLRLQRPVLALHHEHEVAADRRSAHAARRVRQLYALDGANTWHVGANECQNRATVGTARARSTHLCVEVLADAVERVHREVVASDDGDTVRAVDAQTAARLHFTDTGDGRTPRPQRPQHTNRAHNKAIVDDKAGADAETNTVVRRKRELHSLDAGVAHVESIDVG
jgi:hypothetical protein